MKDDDGFFLGTGMPRYYQCRSQRMNLFQSDGQEGNDKVRFVDTFQYGRYMRHAAMFSSPSRPYLYGNLCYVAIFVVRNICIDINTNNSSLHIKMIT
jgi:hypothetical protein